MTDERPRVRVRAEPRGRRTALVFAEPCPYCGRYHVHGDGATGALDVDGTYGERFPHCDGHTHERRADGRLKRVSAKSACPVLHPPYVLVPA